MLIEQLNHSINAFLEPVFYVADSNKRIYWLFLISSVLMALYVSRNSEEQRSRLRDLFRIKTWVHPSSLVDFQWLFINSGIRVLIIVPLIGSQIAAAMVVNRGLVEVFGSGNYFHWQSIYVSALFTFVLFLGEDFTRFFWHYLYHKVPILWRFHAVHHSAEVLTPITLYRIHSIELLLNTCRSILVVGGLSGLFVYLFAGKISIVDIMGASVLTLLFNLLGANLRHTSVWVSFGKFERFFVSPAQHQIHHSSAPQHIDKNFGSCLSIWDRLFGSLVMSQNEKVQEYGLANQTVKQRFIAQLKGL